MVSRFLGGRRPGVPEASKKGYVPEAEAPSIDELRAPESISALFEDYKGSMPNVNVEVAHFTAKNWGARHENEDRWIAVQDSLDKPKVGFYHVGVLDGHDTEIASDTVSRLLPDAVGRRLKVGKSFREAYVEAMSEMEECLKKVHSSAGTCVNACLVVGRSVLCANLGDCRAVLIAVEAPTSPVSPAKASHITWMSRDHKASTPHERKRILEAGGQVLDGRVEGLEPSRTLGDFDVKLATQPGVISIIPEIRHVEISDGEIARHAILFCGTDGVWDVISGQDICDLIQARKDLGKILLSAASGEAPGKAGQRILADLAEDIVQFAVAKGSRDDCTCIAAMINVLPCGHPPGP